MCRTYENYVSLSLLDFGYREGRGSLRPWTIYGGGGCTMDPTVVYVLGATEICPLMLIFDTQNLHIGPISQNSNIHLSSQIFSSPYFSLSLVNIHPCGEN
jgi:hypothetical protein